MLTRTRFFSVCISVLLTCMFLFTIVSYCHAGGYIEGTLSQDYLNSPAVGSNVIAYMIGEWRDPAFAATSIHLVVRRCECLRRLEYTSEGVFITNTPYLTQSEFDSLVPETLVGMVDNDGVLSSAIAGGPGIIAIIEKVLEYKKVGTRFVARVNIKFVTEAQSAEAAAQ